MKKRVVLAMCIATVLASLTNLGLFYAVTVFLVDPYLEEVGALVHKSEEENKALLNLVTQGSILGGLGGSLYVFQLIASYIAKGDIKLMVQPGVQNYFMYALIVPIKGLVAGLIGTTIIGGALMMMPGDDWLRDGHLLVIGCACIAGYSEQFLQRVIDLAGEKLDSVGSKS